MIIITGQTATGKTKLALELAKKYNGELINFDSRQIYKYLDIITGKDIPQTKIWLYDVVKPDQYFSSFDFSEKAKLIIKDIIKRGKEPILVGGSYFYLKHLLYGFDTQPVPANSKLRQRLNMKSVSELQEYLNKINPVILKSLNNSDRNNPRRLIRKIEICEYVKKFKGLKVKKNPNSNIETFKPFNFKNTKFIGIKYKNKEDLIAAIKKRVKNRIEQGAIDEVKSLLKKGYKKTDPGMKTIGYQEIIAYLKGNISQEEAIMQWTNHEIQYAKRQFTFMKKDKNIIWKEI